MEIVELRVQVEKSQLDALQAQVKALQGTTINFGTGAGGSGGKGSDPSAGVRAGLAATEKQANRTGQSILSVVGKVAKWTAVTTAVYAPIRAFKEAVTTIKALDTEMVNIQKVTGATSQQMKQFQAQAYDLATEYGRNVTEVAETMTAFARAGYGEQLDQMAELSTLLQNVGYVSADTANSMLLAVDAAWHLNGSQTELMAVLDGVDKITNQNATDFGKMAEGMTVAASVFAESGESIQTFAAMVGTGTAVTQRSGSEIARGLRTVLMNIRQIKGETEDGELIDGESIANASKALKEFAGINTMENGELRKASDILSELAAKWDELDSVQQSAISEALAGKRQANILMALMGNWELYEKQMEEYATAAGTALKENEIYMDSWAAKSEQLKSSWTEFVSGLVNTDAVKGVLDGLISAVQFLDSDLGHAAIQAGALALALASVSKAALAIGGSAVFKDLTAFISLLSTEGIAAFGALTPALTAFAAIAALAGDFVFMAKAIDEAYVSLSEQKDIVADLQSQYEQLTGAGSEYAQLMEKVNSSDNGVSALTERERNRLTVLNAQADALQHQLDIEQKIAFQKFQQQEAGTYQMERGQMVDTGIGQRGDERRLKEMNRLYEEGMRAVENGTQSLEDYRGTLQDIIADNADWYEQMLEWQDLGLGDSFTEAQKEAMKLYETISKLLNLGDEDLPIVTALDKFEKKGSGFTEFANQTVVSGDKLRQSFAEMGYSAEEAQQAIDGLRADGVVVVDIQSDGVEDTLQYLEDLGVAVETADGWEIDVDGLENLASELGLSTGLVDALIQSLGGINGVSFSGATDSINIVYGSVNDLIGLTGQYTGGSPYNATLTAKDNASSTINGAVNALKNFASKTITLTARYVTTGNGTGGGGWGSGSAGLHKAKGDTNFEGGRVLLGDELSPDGAPRPELVITKDGAFLAGINGPVMTTLPSGTRILSYRDTMVAMSGADMTKISAYAGGDGLGGVSLSDRYLRGANAGGGGGGNNNANNATNTNAGGGNKGGGGGGNANKAKGGGGKAKGGGGGSGGSSSTSDAEDEYLKQLQDELDLLRAQYDFLEASGASTDDLIAKSGEIQGKLHDINERLRETGGEEKDIVSNSTDWYEELDKIRKVQKEIYENERDLLQSNLTLMEHQGKSAGDRISQLRRIQDNLHREAEYLRSIKADQKEINELSIEWWETQNEILEIQNALWEELDAAVQKELKKARDARDDEIAALDARLDRLQAERNAKQEQLDLEEKLKKVEEARFALENAQNERNVRYYNAATGQWEWGADAKTVKSAKENLEQAQKDLKDYQDELAYQATIDAINRRKEAINAAYDALEAGWEKITDSIQEPGRDISLILQDIARNGTPLMKAQVDATGKLLGDLNNYIRAAIAGTTGESFVGGGGTASKDYTTDRTDYSALMDRATTESEFLYWAEQRENKAKAQGIDIKGSGWRTTGEIYEEWKANQASGKSYSSSSGGGGGGGSSSSSKSKTAKSSSGGSYTIGSEKGLNFVNNASAGSTMTGGDGSTWTKNSDGSTTITKGGNTYKVYDSGGVLSGMGGIKGTSEDEIVIPPALANYMLRPSANQQFQQRMAELGFLYGAGPMPSSVVSGMSGRGGSSHYGDIYQYGNITLSEEQAKSMTVYELAQKSRGLSVYAAM